MSLPSGLENEEACMKTGDLELEDLIGAERGLDNTIWSVNENALRDLLVFLVRKHRIDDVYDSKVKARNWEKLIQDFNIFTENRVKISKPQIFRKWHNWKQYNKAHKKPHPFVISGGIDEKSVTVKCQELCLRARRDPAFASLLAKGPTETLEVNSPSERKRNASAEDSDTWSDASPAKKSELDPTLGRLIAKKDFLVRRTGASAAALSTRRLQHEINLEHLSFETEKWRVRNETNKLLQQKIHKEMEIAEVRLERAQAEFNLKRTKCIDMGLID